jgi:peroxiredoxin
MRRKLHFLLFASLLILATACNKHKVIIEGTIDGLDSKTKLYLSELTIPGQKTIDSTEVNTKGHFRFKIDAQQPRFLVLSLKDQTITLLAEPGEKISIKTSSKQFGYGYKLKGSYESGLLQLLNEDLFDTQKQIDSLQLAYNNAQKNNNKVLSDTISTHYEQLVKKHKRFLIEYILQNLTSPVSIAAIYQEITPGNYVLNTVRDLQYVKLVSDSLKKYHPEMPQVKALLSERERLLSQYSEMKLRAMASKGETRNYPDIQLPDANGVEQKLSSLDGNIIVLAFWTSTDENSTLMQSDLFALYREFGPKGLKIYQVSFDSNKNEWSKFIAKYNEPWTNVIDVRSSASPYLGIFNLQSIPSNFVIGKKGIIVGRDISGNELKKVVQQQFR